MALLNMEIRFTFQTGSQAWSFMREVDGECAGAPGFPSLDETHAVRVIPSDQLQVDQIAQKYGGTRTE